MIWSKLRFQHSFELLPRVLKEVAPLLFPISLLLWSLEFYMAWLNKARFDNPYDSSMTTMVAVGVIGIVLQSFAAVIWLLYVAKSTQRQMKNGHGRHPFLFLKEHFHQCFIEYIRAFISIGIYAVFFIIPGIYRWIQMLFVTLVSAFDPEYQQGNKDALGESARLVRGAFLPLLFLLAFQVTLPALLEETAKAGSYPPPVTVLLYLISWVITLYFSIYFALTFFARWSYKSENK